jgi:hypothetical protein
LIFYELNYVCSEHPVVLFHQWEPEIQEEHIMKIEQEAEPEQRLQQSHSGAKKLAAPRGITVTVAFLL